MPPEMPALALLEFDSIAAGYVAADAMAKRASLARLRAGTVQPGRLLVLLAGAVAQVEEALEAGREVGNRSLIDQVYLPGVHPQVVEALAGQRIPPVPGALGIVETATASSAIAAADAGLKGAEVSLVELRLSDGLGGRGLCFFAGRVSAAQIAVELAVAEVSPGQLIHATVIPQLSPELAAELLDTSRWAGRQP